MSLDAKTIKLKRDESVVELARYREAEAVRFRAESGKCWCRRPCPGPMYFRSVHCSVCLGRIE